MYTDDVEAASLSSAQARGAAGRPRQRRQCKLWGAAAAGCNGLRCCCCCCASHCQDLAHLLIRHKADADSRHDLQRGHDSTQGRRSAAVAAVPQALHRHYAARLGTTACLRTLHPSSRSTEQSGSVSSGSERLAASCGVVRCVRLVVVGDHAAIEAAYALLSHDLLHGA